MICYSWRGKHRFQGARDSTSILSYPGVRSEPGLKPVALLERLIQDGCPPEGRVYDPWLAWGSVILAAETQERIGYGISEDPRDLDRTIRRWKALTGEEAYLPDGTDYAQLEALASQEPKSESPEET
jgi:DNA modification methylase